MSSLLPTDVDTFSDFINDHLLTFSFQGHSQEFLPKHMFEKITTYEMIRMILSQDRKLLMSSQDIDNFATEVHEKATKMFVTCVYCGLSMAGLKALLDASLSDEDFPLDRKQCPDNLDRGDQRTFTNNFIGIQKYFNAPFFILDSSCELNEHYPIPIESDRVDSNLRGKGAYGEVWEVKIHKNHHGFKCHSGTHRFAMKVVEHTASMKEQKFINDIKDLRHNHLVKCLTSWTLCTKYYMIYELASWNLEEFIRKFEAPKNHPELTNAWLIQQLCGIAGALRVVHNQEPEDGMLNVPTAARTQSGYIHDLKPANILVFVYRKDTYWFRLSDFSCAKVVDLIASMSGKHDKSHVTISRVGTPDYRPPEFLNKNTSRPYDLWSLGCVILELLVWFLQGYSELDAFRDAREGYVRPGGLFDSGFFFTEEEGPKFVNQQIRPAVLQKITQLSDCCPADLKPILDIVPALLMIKPQERLKAKDLERQLKQLDTSPPFEFSTEMYQASNLATGQSASGSQSESSDSDTNQYVVVHKPTDETSG